MLDLIREADVSSGTFQNIFRTKDGALMELIHFMFDNQFGAARRILADKQNPVLVYAAETAIQMAIAESNENLREIYVEAYTQPQLAEYIYEKTSTELCKIFGEFNPGWADSDFYESKIGSAGIGTSSYCVATLSKGYTWMRSHCKYQQQSDNRILAFDGSGEIPGKNPEYSELGHILPAMRVSLT